jgi:hypothetical protein
VGRGAPPGAGRTHRDDDHAVGVELFQIESYDPARCDPRESDPIQIALGVLKGQLEGSQQ